jgi:hypothetical protein
MIDNILIVSVFCVFRFIKYTHMTPTGEIRYSDFWPNRCMAALYR